jgi:hypothetical protein
VLDYRGGAQKRKKDQKVLFTIAARVSKILQRQVWMGNRAPRHESAPKAAHPLLQAHRLAFQISTGIVHRLAVEGLDVGTVMFMAVFEGGKARAVMLPLL